MAVRIKCICLNVCGFGNRAKQCAIFDLMPDSKADVIFLQETLVAKDDAIESLWTQWPGKSFWSPALGKQGGASLLISDCFSAFWLRPEDHVGSLLLAPP